MDPSGFGAILIPWTIRIGLAAYLIALVDQLLGNSTRWARVAWTIGALACVLHIALAMQYKHDWSNAAAYDDTARQTREMIGLNWGGGIYINYLFAGVWLADALWWWIAPLSRAARPRWLAWLVHGFLAFIIFNATVVFKSGPTRWTAVAACLALGLLACVAVRRPRLRSATDA